MRVGWIAAVLLGCGVLACSSGPPPSTPNGSGGASGSAAQASGAAAVPTSGSGIGNGGATATGGASRGGASLGGSAVDGGSTGNAGGTGGAVANVPNEQAYEMALYGLVELLLTTQVESGDNRGGLVSPSNNPEPKPIHSRAGEAVYPLAVAFKHSQKQKYATAAIELGNWMVSVQTAAGSWWEEWPKTTGWDGTSVDQLISLANAYVILKEQLSAQERAAWTQAITRCADWTVANFPKGNINYVPTGAVALVSASRAIEDPKPGWLGKAASLMTLTTDAINAEDLLTGEGNGVDLGYNIAQSIGYIAMYGLMLPSPSHVTRAAELLEAHQHFMYPGGAIDNSWGTRSFKWNLESGTKTAPGVFFSFALLADKAPSFQRGAQLALSYLREHGQDDDGWLVYGPHAFRHATSNPPSNYGTFARAQSIATALEFGPKAAPVGEVPADKRHWLKQFPSVKTGVFRTDKLMATISAYGEISSYPRESMARGGSVSALWFEGYGSTGFLQVSSPTVYSRIEAMHMPIEQGLLPLTPRVESTSGTYYASVLDDKATLTLAQSQGGVHATATGVLRSLAGASSGTSYTWTYEFGAAEYTKQLSVSAASGLRIVEPFVDDTGNTYEVVGKDAFAITTAKGSVYQLKVSESSGPYSLTAGQDRAKYWSPFPGLDAYPVVITPSGSGSFSIKYTVKQTK